MTPFPESEDMTIKRLYVALKRGDTQLLKMGAHKLHEKFHTGHQFKLIDNLKEILSYTTNAPDIPNDVRELLVETINNILKDDSMESVEKNSYPYKDSYNEPQNFNQNNNLSSSPVQNGVDKEIINPELIIEEPVFDNGNAEIMPSFENEPSTNQDSFVEEEKYESTDANSSPVQEEIKTVEELEKEFKEENKEQEHQETYKEECENKEENFSQNTEENPEENKEEPTLINNEQKDIHTSEAENQPLFIENNSDLKNVAVFYDDKALYTDFKKNRIYREILNSISTDNNKDPMGILAEIKNLVDVPTDEVFEVVKMLNKIKSDVYFITTSKSENIIKAFIENYVSFEIPLVTKQQFSGKTTLLIPLLGLSNIFSCPKCGEKEFFGGFHNKVLTLQCKKCASPAYPEIYEIDGLETNSPVYNWIFSMRQMSNSDTWILINPPIETNKGLVIEFLKQSFETCKPKKVYIYSKEQSRREFYKQMFNEINSDCFIKSDFTTLDLLCEEFIQNEMASVKVNQ